MHLPNGVLTPGMAAATSAVGALGFAVAIWRLKRELGERTPVAMGITAAFLFAAQMVNFPVGPGVTGHLIGGTFAAVLLGPWAGATVVGVVLLVQCLLFGDGGITALGANFINMGLLGALGGYAIYQPIRRAIGGRSGILFGAMAAAWFSVLLSAAACSVELAAYGGRSEFMQILGWMVLVHAAIGAGEAIITGLALRSIMAARPELFERQELAPAIVRRRGREWALGGLGAVLAIAAFLAPLAAVLEWPDGLEFVAAKLGIALDGNAGALTPPMPDYQLPLVQNVAVATALAGVVGTIVVLAAGVVLARACDASTSKGMTADVV